MGSIVIDRVQFICDSCGVNVIKDGFGDPVGWVSWWIDDGDGGTGIQMHHCPECASQCKNDGKPDGV